MIYVQDVGSILSMPDGYVLITPCVRKSSVIKTGKREVPRPGSLYISGYNIFNKVS
jgi:hypothetical protein